ncbi:MAG: hypothetical protein HKN68_06120 [Saprospiraceae bacterium]|nr:hypothetical protein [Saprospiraceae bacterium]
MDHYDFDMKRKWKSYERIMYIAIIVIAFGIIFNTTLSESMGSLGTVFIAIGGLLFISAMSRKKKEINKQSE